MSNRPDYRNSPAFRRGQVDYIANAPPPYPRDSKEFRAWLAGWQNRHRQKNKSHVVALRAPRNVSKQ